MTNTSSPAPRATRRLLSLALPLLTAALALALPHTPPPVAAPGGITGFSAEPAHTGQVDGRVGTRLRTLWTADVGIQGYNNSPVVIGTHVIVSSYGSLWNEPDERDGVYVVRRTDGAVVHHLKTPCDANGVSTNGVAIFAALENGTVHAWELASGRPLWAASPYQPGPGTPVERMAPRDAYQRGYDEGYRAGYAQAYVELGYVDEGSAPGSPKFYGAPLVLEQGLLVAGADGMVVLLDPATGNELRRYEARGKVRNHSAGEGLIAFGNSHSEIEAHGVGGKLQWRWCINGTGGCGGETSWSGDWMYAAPAIRSGRVAVCGPYYSESQFALLDAASGRVLWSFGSPSEADRTFGGCKASPALTDKLVLFADTSYGNDGRLMAHSISNGQRRWMIQDHGGSWGAPVVVGKTVVWVTYPGHVVIANLDTGKELATMELGDTVFATPAVADGVIYVGGDSGKLYAIDTGIRR